MLPDQDSWIGSLDEFVTVVMIHCMIRSLLAGIAVHALGNRGGFWLLGTSCIALLAKTTDLSSLGLGNLNVCSHDDAER